MKYLPLISRSMPMLLQTIGHKTTELIVKQKKSRKRTEQSQKSKTNNPLQIGAHDQSTFHSKMCESTLIFQFLYYQLTNVG